MGHDRILPIFDVFDKVATGGYNFEMEINLKQAKDRLSELVEKASGGETIVVTVHGIGKAKIVPMTGERKRLKHPQRLLGAALSHAASRNDATQDVHDFHVKQFRCVQRGIGGLKAGHCVFACGRAKQQLDHDRGIEHDGRRV